MEAKSNDKKNRALSPEEAAAKARRGERVVGVATGALGFSSRIEPGAAGVFERDRANVLRTKPMIKTPEALAQMITDAGLAQSSDVHGFSEIQIKDLERTHNIVLPEAYKRFLRAMGNSSEEIFYSFSFVYPGIEKQRSWAYEFAEQSEKQLSPSTFVFLIDDAMFLYFHTANGDDPPVYRFVEGQDPSIVSDSFSQWLSDFVQQEVKLEIENKAAKKAGR